MSDRSPEEIAVSAAGRSFGLVAARWNGEIVDRLLDGAIDALLARGAARGAIEVVRVPGAWEIPLALEELARRELYSGLVALGAVIRGETAHFEVICSACTDGCARVMERHAIPVGFGVLTCNNRAEAEARAGAGSEGNKGREAALAALEMADLLARLRG
ncbi:MAG TPA: 6,7-dimethyl-8-ribityllumazine synthase [Thermoanaerobaculia bacterium]|nr:6,7-dimethyl-8-ribityllumazine synthase [Thermoanaerobaculia bacterium]